MSQSVGAVVVNYNGADRVLRAIEALLAQTTPLEDIVVVDNQSTDGSPDQILETFPSVRLLALPSNVGLPAARNAGIRELGCEYVLLVDHDIYLEPDGVCRLLESFEAPDVAVVCPRTRLLPQRDIIQMEGAAPHFLGTLTLRHGYQPVDRIPIAISTNLALVSVERISGSLCRPSRGPTSTSIICLLPMARSCCP